MTYILPYAIQKGNLIYLLKSGSDVQSVKPSMPQHVRSHLEVHRINQLTFMKKGSDIEAQLHVRTHLFHKLFFGVASPGVFRATHFLMVKVIHNDRVPRLCSSVGQLVVHEGTAVFFRQPFRLILQTTEVASVPLVVDSVVQRNQVRMFFTYIVKDVFFESASQV